MSQVDISVIMPIRNEVDFIAGSIDAVSAQMPKQLSYEIIVVDGDSDDGTKDILRQISDSNKKISFLINKDRIVPISMNMGIKTSSGRYILRVDGHCELGSGYISRCYELLQNDSSIWCCGGPIITQNATFIGKAISTAMASRFGVGGVSFRCGASAGMDVDTLAFGMYRRDVFDRIGMFDEELVRNQDDELNLRITCAGGRIYLDPSIHSIYYSRSNLKKLWKQYFGYGFWKVRVQQKHGMVASWRHLIPAIFVTSIILASILSIFSSWSFLLLQLILGAYFSVSLAVSLGYFIRLKAFSIFLMPIVFSIMHTAYGLGYLCGLNKFHILKKR